MKKIALITTVLLAILSIVASTSTAADTERDALMALYNSTNGPGWTYNTGWGTDTDHCTWHGVNCTDGLVTDLGRSDNQLNGTIPPELGNLTSLYYLDLCTNQLTGPIPPELENLSNLGALVLCDNNLTGPIPPELSNLSSLEFLDLVKNQLTGLIPPDLGKLDNLVGLYLHDNQLRGPIPASLSDLGNLTYLDLSNNPDLVCWQNQQALDWAVGLEPNYHGPEDVCPFVCLPMVVTAGD